MRFVFVLSAVVGLGACGVGEAPAPEVPARCQAVHIDRLDTDWVIASGDPKTRARVVAHGEGYRMYWVAQGAAALELEGVKRASSGDVQFTEIPRGNRAKRYQEGQLSVVRAYAKPVLKECALHLFLGKVAKSGKESGLAPRPLVLAKFPEAQVGAFSFEPPDAPLFLGEAAQDPKKAAMQLEALGEPQPDHPFGKIPVGLWSDPAKDGDAGCSYDMDLYFDGQRTKQLGLPAGTVDEHGRHWFVEWDAPYSGNHLLEIHRYRNCGGERVRIGVAATEAILT